MKILVLLIFLFGTGFSQDSNAPPTLQNFGDQIKDGYDRSGLEDTVDKFKSIFSNKVEDVKESLGDLEQKALQVVNEGWDKAKEGFKTVQNKIEDGVETVESKFEQIRSKRGFSTGLDVLKERITQAYKDAKSDSSQLQSAVVSGTENIKTQLQKAFGNTGIKLSDEAASELQSAIQPKIDDLKTSVDQLKIDADGLQSKLQDSIAKNQDKIDSAVSEFNNFMKSDEVKNVKKKVKNFFNTIKNKTKKAIQKAKKKNSKITEITKEDVQDKLEEAVNKAKNTISNTDFKAVNDKISNIFSGSSFWSAFQRQKREINVLGF